jgi:hypothetical protein
MVAFSSGLVSSVWHQMLLYQPDLGQPSSATPYSLKYFHRRWSRFRLYLRRH